MTAVVGPNGAGKSTLVKLAAGRERPTSGAVRIVPDGGHAIAFMPQRAEVDVSFPITVLDFVSLGAWRRFGALATPENAIGERARQALGEVGLTESAGRFVGELSIGNLQRVLFARLLLLDAPCILLDEPFAGIDEATTLDLLAILRRWHGQGRTIAAVLHDLDHVRDVFPDCLLLAQRVVGWGATDVVLTEGALRDARTALLSQ
jgi:zinc/manganese transport system ATP-binding protein